MNLQLADDVAVVFGAARGIGWATAAGFVAEAARVVLVDRDKQVMAQAQRLAADSGVRTLGLVADVADAVSVAGAVEAIYREFGRLDHVVHAAAVGSGKYGFPFWKLAPQDWPRVLEVNVTGTANVLHAVAPRMAEAGRGTVLLVSSVAGQIGSQTDPPYSASKAAVINFAQCAARDLAALGVRVNCLCPGMVKTAINRAVWQSWADRQPPDEQQSYEAWAEEKIRRLVPLGRWQEPEDMAAMAVFLASPRAKNVTGQTINVDGGFVMHW